MISTNSHSRPPGVCALFAVLGGVLLLLCGCRSTPGNPPTAEDIMPQMLRLAPGDVLDITFPGATNLSGMHRIGPEGTITMPLVGQIEAVGKSADQLQTQLIGLYSGELKDTNIIVSIAGSGNVVYIEGAIGRPGRIVMERPLTALEAIMEAGGFAETANKKKVTIIRYKGTENTTIEVNLDPILKGGPVPPFYLRPRDIIHVPARIQWF
jgi:polysaccharide biosynthesis/export protein